MSRSRLSADTAQLKEKMGTYATGAQVKGGSNCLTEMHLEQAQGYE